MLSLRPQPSGRAGGARSTRRASEHATRVPTSKKCKLDIKRKHLRGCLGLRGSLHNDSHRVNLQLQIDGENLPDLFKCTIKKHVNNKTSCVSYRLQGTGIYNHLRGLYMRGFCGGEDPGVVVLVATSEAAPDLPYADLSDGDDGEGAAEALAAARDDAGTDSEQEQERPKQRPRRTAAARPAPARQRRQRKRRRDETDEDEEDEEEVAGRIEEEEEQEALVAGPSGRRGRASATMQVRDANLSARQQQQQQQLAQQQQQQQHRHRHQRLRSHAVHLEPLSPTSPGAGGCGASPAPGGRHPGLGAHPLTGRGHGAEASAGDDDGDDNSGGGLGVSTSGEQYAPTLADVGRRLTRNIAGPGPGSSLEPMAGPFDDVAIGMGLGVGLGGLGDPGGLPGSVGEGAAGLLGLRHDGGCGGSGGIPVAAGGVAEADMHHGGGSGMLGGGGAQHLRDDGGSGMPGDGYGHHHHHHHQLTHQLQLHHDEQHHVDHQDHLQHHHEDQQQHPPYHLQQQLQDPQIALPLSLSPFSPRLLQELTGRAHPHRSGGHQQAHQTANAFGGNLPPLDFDAQWPRQQLGWGDPMGLGLL